MPALDAQRNWDGNAMSELVTLSPESVEAVAEALAAKLAPNTRPELSTAEAMQLTGHRSESAFYRWAASRRVKHIAQGRYRRTALLRALGQ